MDNVSDTITKYGLILPPLELLLELKHPEMYFPVPGMYGGFSYVLKGNETEGYIFPLKFIPAIVY